MGLSNFANSDHWKYQPRDEEGKWSDGAATAPTRKASLSRLSTAFKPGGSWDKRDPKTFPAAFKNLFGDKVPSASDIERAYSIPGFKTKIDIVGDVEYGIADVAASIHDENGNVVATMTRNFTKGKNGISVQHDTFHTDPAHPHIGRELLRKTTEFHRSLGVNHITVSPHGNAKSRTFDDWEKNIAAYKAARADILKATSEHKAGRMSKEEFTQKFDAWKARVHQGGDLHAGQIGPYAWASIGFKWQPWERDIVASKLLGYLVKEHNVAPEHAKKLVDGAKEDPRKVVALRIGDKRVGAHFMMDRIDKCEMPWKMDMTDGDPNWEHYKKSLGM